MLVVVLELLESFGVLVGDLSGELPDLVWMVLHDLLLVRLADLFLCHGAVETEHGHGSSITGNVLNF